jgi:hypothetical protein
MAVKILLVLRYEKAHREKYRKAVITAILYLQLGK